MSLKIPNGMFVSIRHPDLKDTFIVRKRNLDHFLQVNKEIWEKYKVDTKKFNIEDVWLKDKKIDDLMQKEHPEEFL